MTCDNFHKIIKNNVLRGVGKSRPAKFRKSELVLYPDSDLMTASGITRQQLTINEYPEMKNTISTMTKSVNAFIDPNALSLQDIKKRIISCEALTTTRKRDFISAFSRVEKASDSNLAAVKAAPVHVRKLLQGITPAKLNVKDKSCANIKSLIVQAVRMFGMKTQQLTKRIPLSSQWHELLTGVKTDFVRQGLYRLATFCTVMEIPPSGVSLETLVALHDALETEELVKNPRTVLKITITSWNRCRRTIEAWPQIMLSSPFRRTPTTINLDQFPLSLQNEIKGWSSKLLNPDILDTFGVGRALRQTSVHSRILQIRQFASALIKSDKIKIEDVTSLAVLLEPGLFRQGLQCFLARHDGKPTARIFHMANGLRYIGKNHCRLDQDALDSLKALCDRLKPKNRNQITDKNRERLSQFDERANVTRLLEYPKNEADRALTEKNPLRAAKRFERAVIVVIFLNTGLRSGSLRQLEISDFDFKSLQNGKCLLFVEGHKVKTNKSLEFELSVETTYLVQKLIQDYRPLFPGHQCSYLFPGIHGGCRSKNAISDAIDKVGKSLNLRLNPHLVRHIITKIALEQDPNAAFPVSRLLGHSSLSTTTSFYMGTESRVAGRHLDGLLMKARHAPIIKGGRHG